MQEVVVKVTDMLDVRMPFRGGEINSVGSYSEREQSCSRTYQRG